MNENSTTLDFDSQFQPKQRPTFLTVLCILSFIGSGWGIIQGLINLFSDKQAEMAAVDEAMTEAQRSMAESGAGNEEMFNNILSGASDIVARSVQYQTELSIGAILAAALALIGVLMMWKLRKSGFYLYVIAQLAGIIIPLIFLGTSWMVLGAYVGFAGFLSLVFVVLYAVNLKHMH